MPLTEAQKKKRAESRKKNAEYGKILHAWRMDPENPEKAKAAQEAEAARKAEKKKGGTRRHRHTRNCRHSRRRY
jgi:hypothetical protein